MYLRTKSIRALWLMLALGGCHLIDQRDLDANAGKPPVFVPPKAAAAKPGPPALVRIAFDRPDPEYRDALAASVRRALARKPNVLFTVETIVPSVGGFEAQAAAARSEAVSGKEVAQAIIADGARAAQVEQVVTVETGPTVKEVRVKVQ